MLQKLIYLDFDLSRSHKIRCHKTNGLPIYVYGFLEVYNSNIWPNVAYLRERRFQNLSDIDIDFSRSQM